MSDLTHEFTPGAAALEGVSSEIHPGGCTALLGANGAGKSTLLHLLAGLITPTQGQVLWRGEAVSAQNLKSNAALRARFRRSVGIVFQDPDCQWLCNTVQEEVELGPRQIWSRDEARERAAQVMVLLGVNHLADRPPYALSGGQKRRVALASVIAMDPDVLLLDEPTLSLDAATTDFLLEWLTEFLSDAGKTLVLATHDLALVRELAHSAIVITPCHRLGRSGTAAEVLADVEFLQRMNLASRRRRRFCID
jgi:cobalt/nickel transport system ATP-binding protein